VNARPNPRPIRFLGYIAASADGRIADADGGVGWLDPYPGEAFGYDAFIRDIGTVVMGRASYDFCRGLPEWPYPGRRTVVLTHRDPGPVPRGAEVAFRAGDVGALAAELSRGAGGDVWVMGGGDVLRQFLDAGRLDSLEVYVIPVILGGGPPLFPPGRRHDLRLAEAAPCGRGVVRLRYTPADLV
jgi:dihydrofolate reductase